MTMGIANERFFGTLPALLGSPASRAAVFAGRTVPYILNGLVVSVFGFGVAWLLLDVTPARGGLPGVGLAVLVTTVSGVALGALIGSIGLWARDVFFGANLVYLLMLLVCGVNVANEELPGWLGAIGRALPLTHGIEAARVLARGGTLGEAAGDIGWELLIGVAYGIAVFVVFRLLERESRRRAALDTF
ncbi:MAG: ABC transporter permease [Gaiella sp.]